MGAWQYDNGTKRYFKRGMSYGDTDAEKQRIRYAVASMQRELTALGFDLRKGYTGGDFGLRMAKDVKHFQASRGLDEDGVIGRETAKALWRPAIDRIEEHSHIPDNILCALIRLESAFDAAATGSVRPEDRGLAQINSSAHPELSDEEVFDGLFALRWTRDRLVSARRRFEPKCPDIVWDVVIANHNSPVAAKSWCETGTPPNEDIATYVALVRKGC
jgi:putative peptidoglycan binding protein/transglycosylase-like protein with SLT domain